MLNKTISGLLKIIHAYKTENKRLKALLKAYSIDFESYDDICDHEALDNDTTDLSEKSSYYHSQNSLNCCKTEEVRKDLLSPSFTYQKALTNSYETLSGFSRNKGSYQDKKELTKINQSNDELCSSALDHLGKDNANIQNNASVSDVILSDKIVNRSNIDKSFATNFSENSKRADCYTNSLNNKDADTKNQQCTFNCREETNFSKKMSFDANTEMITETYDNVDSTFIENSDGYKDLLCSLNICQVIDPLYLPDKSDQNSQLHKGTTHQQVYQSINVSITENIKNSAQNNAHSTYSIDDSNIYQYQSDYSNLCSNEKKDLSYILDKISLEVLFASNKQIELFLSFFNGRNDVFAKRWQNPHTGKSCYYPHCDNFYKVNCAKKYLKSSAKNDKDSEKYVNPCNSCQSRKRRGLTVLDIRKHFSNSNYTVGVYPLREDNKCSFMVFDFDDHESDVNQVADNSSVDLSDNHDMDHVVEIPTQKSICNNQRILDDRVGKGSSLSTSELKEKLYRCNGEKIPFKYSFMMAEKRSVEDEVRSFLCICSNYGIKPLLERSRSGKGYHVWFFFEEPIFASLAREFGRHLLEHGARLVNIDSYKTFDRMIPAQDRLTGVGLGNLVALPLQCEPLKRGNSCFLDENFVPYLHQFERLASQEKLSESFIKSKIYKHSTRDSFSSSSLLSDQSSYPQELYKQCSDNIFELAKIDLDTTKKVDLNYKNSHEFFTKDMFKDGIFKIYIRDSIYVKHSDVSPHVISILRKISSYANPLYYRNFSNSHYNIKEPRRILCYEDLKYFIKLPRALIGTLEQMCTASDIKLVKEDMRNEGKKIRVKLSSQVVLRKEQKEACDKLILHENGILNAATGFGKTVCALYIISKLQVNTLILVPTQNLLLQWQNILKEKLEFKDPLPEYTTLIGKVKKHKSFVGQYSSKSKKTTGIIDVALYSSLGKDGEYSDLVENYGLVIADECHNIGATSYYQAVCAITAKRIYGLSATMYREDGKEKSVMMQLGPIRFKYSAKDYVLQQNFEHFVFPRFTRVVSTDEDLDLSEIISLLSKDNSRNSMIIKDVRECIKQKRIILVLSKSVAHCTMLYEQLKNVSCTVLLLRPNNISKDDIVQELAKINDPSYAESAVLISTVQLISEGFDVPALDTLMITLPVSYKTPIEQMLGRINRNHCNKHKVIVYDYIDPAYRMLQRMYAKRLKVYQKLGFSVTCINNDSQLAIISKDTNRGCIFTADEYRLTFMNDIKNAVSEIVIAPISINIQKLAEFYDESENVLTKSLNLLAVLKSSNDNRSEDNAISSYTKAINTVKERFKIYYNDKRSSACIAIIDRKIVWYGLIDFWGNNKTEDNSIRVADEKIASEILQGLFNQQSLSYQTSLL